jgi:hypothetical protein
MIHLKDPYDSVRGGRHSGASFRTPDWASWAQSRCELSDRPSRILNIRYTYQRWMPGRFCPGPEVPLESLSMRIRPICKSSYIHPQQRKFPSWDAQWQCTSLQRYMSGRVRVWCVRGRSLRCCSVGGASGEGTAGHFEHLDPFVSI